MSEINYEQLYSGNFLQGSDGHQNVNAGHIKFGDALAAIAYAHGITYEQITERFPEIKGNERYSKDKYSVHDQIDFIKQNATRTPKKILEIGAGRGEVTLFLDAMGYSVTAVEPSPDFLNLLEDTKEKLFKSTTANHNRYKVINSVLHEADIDYSQYDTILMVESLEHILAEHFDPQWERIKTTFAGYFIVVNWKQYHPIKVGQYANPQVHCRLVDEKLYDYFCEDKLVHVRDRSHLCVELSRTPVTWR